MSAPIAKYRRATRVTWVAGGIGVSLAALWAMRAQVTPDLPAIPTASTRTAPTVDTVSASRALPGFAMRFSPAPPPVAPTPRVAPVETPIAQRLQLLGIVREGGALVAALYDPSDDRVHLVRDGEQIANVEVRRVESRSVLLAKGSRTRTLTLSGTEAKPPHTEPRADDPPTSGGSS